MNSAEKITIIIPCFNEGKMLDVAQYQSFVEQNNTINFCFVNDGSSDNTLEKIQDIKSKQCFVLSLDKNQGKAEAVRQGVQYVLKNIPSNYIGYFDADLSTPLNEIFLLREELNTNPNLEYVFGSRILKVGSKIDRKFSRFIIGRIIATFISKVLKIKVYDTQCGAKLFRRNLAENIFQEPFISKWLFDVELLFRILNLYGRLEGVKKLKEVPLNIWVEKGNSKIKWTYGLKVWVDLLKIKQTYKNV